MVDSDQEVDAAFLEANGIVRKYHALMLALEKVPDLPDALPLSLLPAPLNTIKRSLLMLAGSQYIKGTLDEASLSGWMAAFTALGRFVPDPVDVSIERLAAAITDTATFDRADPARVRAWAQKHATALQDLQVTGRVTKNVSLNRQILLEEFQTAFQKIITPQQ